MKSAMFATALTMFNTVGPSNADTKSDTASSSSLSLWVMKLSSIIPAKYRAAQVVVVNLSRFQASWGIKNRSSKHHRSKTRKTIDNLFSIHLSGIQSPSVALPAMSDSWFSVRRLRVESSNSNPCRAINSLPEYKVELTTNNGTTFRIFKTQNCCRP